MRKQSNLRAPPASVIDLFRDADLKGRDFSGTDLHRVTLNQKNFFESIFNGCDFERVWASQCVFQHAEFTETSLVDCVFEDTSFDHSDFVLSTIRCCTFVRCTFQNAEWRDASFEQVQFKQCIFRHTTTSLSRFVRCKFDRTSSSNFVGPSKRFSVFSDTEFELVPSQLDFLRTSFGIAAKTSGRAHPPTGDDVLFGLSLDHYFGDLTVERLARGVMRAAEQLADDGSPSMLRLKYLVEICKASCESRRFSVFAMRLLQAQLNDVLFSVSNRDVLLELMSLALTLRVHMREQMKLVDEEIATLGVGDASGVRCAMTFERTYDRLSIERFVGMVTQFCGLAPSAFSVDVFKVNSTYVELSISAMTNIPQLVRALRYSLSAVKVTLEQAKQAKAAASRASVGRQLAQSAAPPSRAMIPSKPRVPRKRGARKGGGDNAAAHRKLLADELLGEASGEAREIEVVVNAAKESVLIVEGDVRVMISFA